VRCALGDRMQTLDALEQAYAAPDVHLPFPKITPSLGALQGEPRFDESLRRLGCRTNRRRAASCEEVEAAELYPVASVRPCRRFLRANVDGPQVYERWAGSPRAHRRELTCPIRNWTFS